LRREARAKRLAPAPRGGGGVFNHRDGPTGAAARRRDTLRYVTYVGARPPGCGLVSFPVRFLRRAAAGRARQRPPSAIFPQYFSIFLFVGFAVDVFLAEYTSGQPQTSSRF